MNRFNSNYNNDSISKFGYTTGTVEIYDVIGLPTALSNSGGTGVGPQGPQGDIGPPGDPGIPGETGIQGIQGLKGDTGIGGSNIYLYDNSTVVLAQPGIGKIRYNNSIQDNATEIYVSSLTRDGIDIDEFLTLICDLSIIYIQDQNSSINFIKYSVVGIPIILINDYITIPVLKQSSGGTGSYNFPNGQQIFMSIFSNTTLIDNKITVIETKTQNQTAITGSTTFSGKLSATKLQVNALILSNPDRSCILTDADKSSINGGGNTIYGSGAGISLINANSNTFLGYNAGNNVTNANWNVGIGQGALSNVQTNFNIAIGNALTSLTTGDYNVCIGSYNNSSNVTGSYNVSIGNDTMVNNTGSNNVAIGYNCGNTVAQYTNTITLGNSAVCNSSNQCVIGNTLLTEVKTSGVFHSSIGFKTQTGTAAQVLCANGTIDNNLFKMARKNWDVIPLNISNGSMVANSWDYYMNDQVPYDMYISKIRVNYSTGGSDTSRFAIYRGNDLAAILVAQTALLAAGSITQPYTTLDFVAISGQNTYFSKDEGIVIAYSSGGTSTRISTVLVGTGNTNLGWYNTTESVGGFLNNPKSKAGASVGAFCCRLITADITP
jgi:hypothetical protein